MNEQQQLAWDILSTAADADFKQYRRTHSATWLNKHRQVILISEMETAHIISCVNMLEALDQRDTKAYQGLTQALAQRGVDRED